MCALILYILWARKPSSVEVPTVIELEGSCESYVAYLLDGLVNVGVRLPLLHPKGGWPNVASSYHLGFEVVFLGQYRCGINADMEIL